MGVAVALCAPTLGAQVGPAEATVVNPWRVGLGGSSRSQACARVRDIEEPWSIEPVRAEEPVIADGVDSSSPRQGLVLLPQSAPARATLPLQLLVLPDWGAPVPSELWFVAGESIVVEPWSAEGADRLRISPVVLVVDEPPWKPGDSSEGVRTAGHDPVPTAVFPPVE